MELLQIAVPVLACTVAGGVVLAILAVTARRDRELAGTVARARRHAVVSSSLAVALGLAAAGWFASNDLRFGDDAGQAEIAQTLAPLAFGVVHTLALAVGELTWPRPRGDVRQALLVRRGPASVAPRWLLATAGVSVLLAVASITTGFLLSAPDGRSLGYGFNEGPGFAFGQLSVMPDLFPGPVFGTPAALGLALLVVLALGALQIVATRAAVVTDDQAVERALRVASGHRVLRGASAAALVVVAGFAFYGGGAVASAAVNDLLRYAGFAALGGGVLTGLLALALLCVPAPRLPRPAVPTDPTPARVEVLNA
jgi:hypothetical protein